MAIRILHEFSKENQYKPKALGQHFVCLNFSNSYFQYVFKIKWQQDECRVLFYRSVFNTKLQKAFGKINIPFSSVKDQGKIEQDKVFVQLYIFSYIKYDCNKWHNRKIDGNPCALKIDYLQRKVKAFSNHKSTQLIAMLYHISVS